VSPETDAAMLWMGAVMGAAGVWMVVANIVGRRR
jgi:hypothetical protein